MVDMYKQVADATAFVRGDGSKLHSLKSLEMALMTMPEYEFTHHVNSTKNDFANWVGAVFNNKELATKLQKSSSRIDMLAVLDEAGRHTRSSALTSSSSASQKLQSSVFSPAKSKPVSSNASSASTSSTSSSAPAKQSKPLHQKLKGMFKKGEKPVEKLQVQKTQPVNISSNSNNSGHSHHTIHAQIEHLDRELAHLTRHHMHTTARENVGSSSLEETVKERILDFALGLIVGLMLGFILAKSLGL